MHSHLPFVLLYPALPCGQHECSYIVWSIGKNPGQHVKMYPPGSCRCTLQNARLLHADRCAVGPRARLNIPAEAWFRGLQALLETTLTNLVFFGDLLV